MLFESWRGDEQHERQALLLLVWAPDVARLKPRATGGGDGVRIKDQAQMPFVFENLALDPLGGGMTTDRIGYRITYGCRKLNDNG